LGFMIFRQKT